MENENIRKDASVHQARTCPVCEAGVLRRIKREGWAARVPLSKSYSCSKCRTSFLRIFDSVQFKVKRTTSNSRKSKRELAIVTFAIFVTVYVCYRIVIHMYDSGVQLSN